MTRVATLDELRAFQTTGEVTPSLNGLLTEIAATGIVRYPWSELRLLFSRRLEAVVKEASQEEDTQRKWIPLRDGLTALSGIPFTVQRLSELLVAPSKQYTDVDKLTSALTKLVCVTSFVEMTTDPPPLPTLDELPAVNENPSPVRRRHVASSEIFKGFLEPKNPPDVNGSTSEATGLTAHLFETQE